MKWFLRSSLLTNALLLCVLFWGGIQAHAVRGGGGSAIGNGDVNGDGAYNLSDAVHLLSWLFRGGPSPSPIENGPPTETALLPATGQSRCYDASGAEVDCAQATCGGQDGAYQAGCPRQGRFLEAGDGTVTDTCTGLMWQQRTADVNLDGKPGAEDLLQRCQGLDYCESLTLAGYNDWRLPNVIELLSLADYGRAWPAIDPIFEIATDTTCYMTSTSLRGGPGPGVFIVEFGLGFIGGGGGIACHVRAVRDVAAGEPALAAR